MIWPAAYSETYTYLTQMSIKLYSKNSYQYDLILSIESPCRGGAFMGSVVSVVVSRTQVYLAGYDCLRL